MLCFDIIMISQKKEFVKGFLRKKEEAAHFFELPLFLIKVLGFVFAHLPIPHSPKHRNGNYSERLPSVQ